MKGRSVLPGLLIGLVIGLVAGLVAGFVLTKGIQSRSQIYAPVPAELCLQANSCDGIA